MASGHMRKETWKTPARVCVRTDTRLGHTSTCSYVEPETTLLDLWLMSLAPAPGAADHQAV